MQKIFNNKSPSTSHSSAAHQGQSAQPSTTAQSAAGIANEVPTHTTSPGQSSSSSGSSFGASAVSKGRFSPDGKTLLEVRSSDLSNGCFDIPAGVTSIGEGAFRGCTGLTQVVIPAGVKSVGEAAFSGCTGLTQVVIPAGVKSVGEAAFSGCTGLTQMTLPAGVTSIGAYAFYDCSSITQMIIPAGVTSIGAYAFYDCTGLTQMTLPAGVTSIGNRAFYGCRGLIEMTIPASVTSIGENAFSKCSPGILLYCPDDAYEQIATLLPKHLRRHLYPEFCRTKFYDLLKSIPRLNAVYQHQEMCGMPDVLMGVIAQYSGNDSLEKEYREALLKHLSMPFYGDKEAYKASIDEHVVKPFIRRKCAQELETLSSPNQSASSKGSAIDEVNPVLIQVVQRLKNKDEPFLLSDKECNALKEHPALKIAQQTAQAVASAGSSTSTATSVSTPSTSSSSSSGAGSNQKGPSSTMYGMPDELMDVITDYVGDELMGDTLQEDALPDRANYGDAPTYIQELSKFSSPHQNARSEGSESNQVLIQGSSNLDIQQTAQPVSGAGSSASTAPHSLFSSASSSSSSKRETLSSTESKGSTDTATAPMPPKL